MGDRKYRRAWWGLAAVTLIAFVMAATPAFGGVRVASGNTSAPSTQPASGLSPDMSGPTPFYSTGSAACTGCGLIATTVGTITTLAGGSMFALLEGYHSATGAFPKPTDSDTSTWSLVAESYNSSATKTALWTATAPKTGPDNITDTFGATYSAAGIWIGTFNYSARILADGNTSDPVTPSALSANSIALFGDMISSVANCPRANDPYAPAWATACFAVSGYESMNWASANVTAGNPVTLEFASGYGSMSWAEISVYTPLPPPVPQGISITHITTVSAELNWTQSPSGIVNNTALLYSGPGCSGIPTQFSTAGAASDYVFTALTNGAWYSAAVTAWQSGARESAASACIDWQSGSAVWWSEITVIAAKNFTAAASHLNFTVNYTAVQGDTLVVACQDTGVLLTIYGLCNDGNFEPQSTWSSGIINYVAATCGALDPPCGYQGVVTFNGPSHIYFSSPGTGPGNINVAIIETPPGTWWANENPAQNDTYGDNYSAAYGSRVSTISAGSPSRSNAPDYTLPFANMLVVSQVVSNRTGTFTSSIVNGVSLGSAAAMNVYANITTRPQVYASIATKVTGATPDYLQLELLPLYWPTSAPTAFTVDNTAFTAANVSWLQPVTGPSNNVVNNTLFLFSGSGCAGLSTQYSTGGYAATYDFTGLRNDAQYSARVTAWNATGQSLPSNCANFMTLLEVAPSLAVSGVSFNSFIETWGNGTWTNITSGFSVYLVFGGTGSSLTNARSDALSPDTGGRLGVWTWTTYVRGAPVQIGNGSTVLYNYNATVNSNTTFASSYAIWVALVMVDGSSYFVFSIQLVTFGIVIPPPSSACPLICILIVVLVTVPLAGTYLFFAINKRWPWQFHEYKVRRNPFWGRRGRL